MTCNFSPGRSAVILEFRPVSIPQNWMTGLPCSYHREGRLLNFRRESIVDQMSAYSGPPFEKLFPPGRFASMSTTAARVLEECRRKHESARARGFKPEVERPGVPSEADVFRRGRVVWGTVVKANQALYRAGKIDSYGCVVFSFDPYFDEHLRDLSDIGSAVWALRNTTPQEPALRALAAIVSDDETTADRVVPTSLTKGREVQYCVLFIPRQRLPTNHLADIHLPVIADPHSPSAVMLLPIALWPSALVNHWKALAAKRPPIPPILVAPTSPHEFMSNLLVLTSAAARQIKSIIVQQRLKCAFLRVGEEHGAYSMDLEEARPNRHRDLSYMAQGIQVTVTGVRPALMGIELDFIESAREGRVHLSSETSMKTDERAHGPTL